MHVGKHSSYRADRLTSSQAGWLWNKQSDKPTEHHSEFLKVRKPVMENDINPIAVYSKIIMNKNISKCRHSIKFAEKLLGNNLFISENLKHICICIRLTVASI